MIDSDGRRARRVAVGAVAIGGLGLVVESPHPTAMVAVVGALALALAVPRLAPLSAETSAWPRAIGAVGGIAAVAGLAASAVLASPAVAGVAALAVLAILTGVATIDDRVGRAHWRALARTVWVAAAWFVAIATVLAPAGGAWIRPSRLFTGLQRVLVATVVGGSPENSLAMGFGLVALCCLVVGLGTLWLPTHVLLTPRVAAEHGESVAILHRWLTIAGIVAVAGAFVFTVPADAVAARPLLVAIVAPIGYALRAAALLAILATLAVVVGLAVAAAPHRERVPERPGVSALAGTALALTAVGPLVLIGRFTAANAPDLVAGTALASVGSALALTALGIGGLHEWFPRARLAAVPLGALSVGALLAGVVLDAALAPIVAVAAVVVAWDGVDLAETLGTELPGVETTALEQRRLGTTVGTVFTGGCASLLLYGLTVVAAPSLGSVGRLALVGIGSSIGALALVVAYRES